MAALTTKSRVARRASVPPRARRVLYAPVTIPTFSAAGFGVIVARPAGRVRAAEGLVDTVRFAPDDLGEPRRAPATSMAVTAAA